jgi:hypothetical protein
MRKTIQSTAHDWVLALPVRLNKLVCVRCGSADPESRCVPHREFASSGYRAEAV